MWFEGFKLAHLPITFLTILALWVCKVLVFSLLCGISFAILGGTYVALRKAGQLHRFRPSNWKQEFARVKSYLSEDLPALLRSWAF